MAVARDDDRLSRQLGRRRAISPIPFVLEDDDDDDNAVVEGGRCSRIETPPSRLFGPGRRGSRRRSSSKSSPNYSVAPRQLGRGRAISPIPFVLEDDDDDDFVGRRCRIETTPPRFGPAGRGGRRSSSKSSPKSVLEDDDVIVVVEGGRCSRIETPPSRLFGPGRRGGRRSSSKSSPNYSVAPRQLGRGRAISPIPFVLGDDDDDFVGRRGRIEIPPPRFGPGGRGRSRSSKKSSPKSVEITVLPSLYPRKPMMMMMTRGGLRRSSRPPPASLGKIRKILLIATENKTHSPQKKLLENIEWVMEELRKLRTTLSAKKAEREERVRLLMSMR